MKRPIKFRGVVISRRAAEGREADIGDIVTGSLIVEDYDTVQLCWIRQKKENFAAIDYPVDPDSVAQLVGYDANGNEIYEGDTVIRYDSEEEFNECPENGVLRKVILYTEVSPDLDSYYCKLKEDTK